MAVICYKNYLFSKLITFSMPYAVAVSKRSLMVLVLLLMLFVGSDKVGKFFCKVFTKILSRITINSNQYLHSFYKKNIHMSQKQDFLKIYCLWFLLKVCEIQGSIARFSAISLIISLLSFSYNSIFNVFRSNLLMVPTETHSSFSSAESAGFSAIQRCSWFSTCNGAMCNPQFLYFTFLSSVWVFKCLFNSHPSLNFFKHFWHLCSLTFLIHLVICLLKLSILLIFFWHLSHSCSESLWVFLCLMMLFWCFRSLLHTGHFHWKSILFF